MFLLLQRSDYGEDIVYSVEEDVKSVAGGGPLHSPPPTPPPPHFVSDSCTPAMMIDGVCVLSEESGDECLAVVIDTGMATVKVCMLVWGGGKQQVMSY